MSIISVRIPPRLEMIPLFGERRGSRGLGLDDGADFDATSQDLGSRAEDHASQPEDFPSEPAEVESWSQVDVTREEEAWYQEAADMGEQSEPAPKKPRTQVAGGGSSAPLHPAVVQALFEERRKPIRKQPWETGFGKAVLGRSGGHDFVFPFQLPLLGRADMFAEIAPASSSTGLPTWHLDNPFRAKRLFATRMARSEDQLRAAALSRIKEIILFDPSDSRLGRSLLESSGLLLPEHQLATVLSDTFARKATSTLAKRSCDFLRFSRWQVQVNSAKPLRASEQDLYKYVCHLRDSGAAPTSLAAFRRMFHSLLAQGRQRIQTKSATSVGEHRRSNCLGGRLHHADTKIARVLSLGGRVELPTASFTPLAI